MTAINISGRLSFEHIFVADSSNGSAPAFSATVLIDKSDQAQIQKIRAEIQRVATEKWKDKAPGLLKSLYATEKLCLRDGDNKEYDGYAGMMYVTSRNKARPTVVDRRCNPVTEADGLACASPSGFVTRIDSNLISGDFTIEDAKLYDFMRLLHKTEDVLIEPSSCAAFIGPVHLESTEAGKGYLAKQGLTADVMKNATQICWATGGRLVPYEVWKEYLVKVVK